jgi:sugar lactone lactonase YvrE
VRRGVRTALLVALAAALLALGSAGASDAGARFEVRVFAHVPAPGYPANAVRAPDGTLYVGTFKSFTAPSDTGPSKVFAFDPAGKLVRTYTVQGQTKGTADAVQVATIDRAGELYLLDQDPARIIKLDPRTGRQTTWATFKSLPACPSSGPCSDGQGSTSPEPDFAAWGPDGSLYVTDYNQALIWRVAPTGGPASVWLTDPRFNGIIVGPAGIELMADRHTFLLSTGGGGTDPATGKLYTLPIEPNGHPGPLRQLWESAPAEAPDGFAIARSGNIYMALVGPTGNAVVEVSPQGRTLARIPSSAVANQSQAVPFDAPGSVTFAGQDVLVTNQAALDNDASNWAVLEISVGERGLPLSLPPRAPRRRTVYRLRVWPRRVIAGHRVTFHFRALAGVGRRRRPLAGARVAFAGHRARTGRRGRATLTLVLRRPGRHRARLIVGRRAAARVSVRATASRRA